MWTALHWVKHNQPGDPGIDMENIFDQQRPLASGIIKGGAGKMEMYRTRKSELRGVEFACKPFDDLFWGLWTLFAKYLRQRWGTVPGEIDPGPGEYPTQDVNPDEDSGSDGDIEPSVSPQEVIDLFEAALKQPGWIDDKVADQFPSAASMKALGMDPSELEDGGGYLNPNQGKKRGFTKSLGVDVDLEQLPAKRPKGS